MRNCPQVFDCRSEFLIEGQLNSILMRLKCGLMWIEFSCFRSQKVYILICRASKSKEPPSSHGKSRRANVNHSDEYHPLATSDETSISIDSDSINDKLKIMHDDVKAIKSRKCRRCDGSACCSRSCYETWIIVMLVILIVLAVISVILIICLILKYR